MYTMNLTKDSITEVSPLVYIIGVEMVVNDSQEDIFSRILVIEYNTNTESIDDIKAFLLQKVKDAWDDYISIKAGFDSSAFNKCLGEVSSEGNSYIDQ